MNKIEKLINELCPNDLTYKKLNEVAVVTAGNSAPQKKQYYTNGKYLFCSTAGVGQVKKSVDFSV
ncbi:restriction endonuclease subunit S domain-containing protein [Mycoplasmopsis bovirhinis]|uniref:Type I restriction enzyme specificity protein n=1 Tax=Mycoplasmopsis bovirhinis TaxID=29553 RepID=A0A449ADC2_9BACT|nr:hypothetical protein [Mycoplasmopsis bovirhinis]VEU63015.1 Type I restriction enzyme specificity protein [Mycoplasmopsis bovirhinis]